MERIRREFGEEDFEWLMVYPQNEATNQTLAQHAKDFGIAYRQVLDTDRTFVRSSGATVTPQAVVINAAGETLYSGRIDDLHTAYGKKRTAPTRQDLREALLDISQGRPVQVSETEPVGCVISD